MAAIIFGILVTIVVMLFLIQLASVALYQWDIKRSPVFEVACAGSEKPDTPKEFKVTNLQWNNFKKTDGTVLDRREYRQFITIGESMLLGGIRNHDILFVKESATNEIPTLPAIMVLRREQAAMERAAQFNDNAEMKIRRSWRVCTLNNSNEIILRMVEEIIRNEQFQRIRSLDTTKFPDNEWLLADFSSRLVRYREEHQDCEKENNVNHKALISTTYDTMQRRVHFSIHSCQTIIGEVKYAYGINHNVEAA